MKKLLVAIVTLLFFVMIIFPSSGIQIKNKPIINPEIGNKPFYVGGQLSRNYFINNFKQKPKYEPGKLIVKFKKDICLSVSSDGVLNIGLKSIDKLNAEFSVTSIEKLFGDSSPDALSNIYMFTFYDGFDVLDVLGQYNNDPNVEYAELNYIGTFLTVESKTYSGNFPNDPHFDQQWGLHNTGQSGGTIDADINAPEAWEIETGDHDVIIAIVDSGVDYTHNDLADNIWNNENEIPDNGIDDDNNGFIDDIRGWDFESNDSDPMDTNLGHGTHCAGIAGAIGNNGIGIAGVCWNCSIMAVRIGDDHGPGENAAARGIVYAADNGADVISMSWGYSVYRNLISDAIEYAYAKGVVLVAAAGNEGNTKKFFPAGHEYVIAVAATDDNDEKAIFSTYGEWVDVAAPGIDILSLKSWDTYINSSGTSMACPYVAGLSGLLLSKHPECPFPAQMVKSVLPATADEVNFEINGGRINALNALEVITFASVLDVIKKWEDIKGTVDISGTAWSEDFQYFVLEYGKGEHPESWTEMVSSSMPQSGILYSWDTIKTDEGLYTIRLHVICDHGIHSDEILLYVNNEADGTYDADIYVSNCYDSSTSGWGKTRFDNINDGLNKTIIGGTVFVYDGFYSENIILKGFLKTSISLIGQSKDFTVIDGYIVIEDTIKITVNGFNLGYKTKDREIYRPGWIYDFAILIYRSSHCTIYDNKFLGYYGEGFIGTELSTKNVIKNNILAKGAIYYFGGEIQLYSSSKSEIYGNENLGFTAVILKSHSNIIKSNTFNEQLWLWNSWNNVVYKNKITDNLYGAVCLSDNSFSNKIVANSIADSGGGLVSSEFANPFIFPMGNQIYFNNFERNKVLNAIDQGFNIWYKIGKRMGNYWDDYDGMDNNGDGIGDTPYEIPNVDGESNNEDRFPLMEPVDIDNVVIEEIEEFMNEIANDTSHQYSQNCQSSKQHFPQLILLLQKLIFNC